MSIVLKSGDVPKIPCTYPPYLFGIQRLHHYQIYLNVPSAFLVRVEAPLAWRRGPRDDDSEGVDGVGRSTHPSGHVEARSNPFLGLIVRFWFGHRNRAEILELRMGIA